MSVRTIIALVVALLASLTSCAQEMSWEECMAAAEEAYKQGRYDEAEELFLVALDEAENFGDNDTRLATSLHKLAELYQAQGKYAEAEPLFQRSHSQRGHKP